MGLSQWRAAAGDLERAAQLSAGDHEQLDIIRAKLKVRARLVPLHRLLFFCPVACSACANAGVLAVGAVRTRLPAAAARPVFGAVGGEGARVCASKQVDAARGGPASL